MLEEKLKVGSVVQLAKPGWTGGVLAAGSMHAQTQTMLTFGHAVGAGKLVGVNPSFRWLTYYKGSITTMAFDGLDIVTGDMSGCWLVAYSVGGTARLAHVGTDYMSAPNSTLVKRTWDFTAQQADHTMLAGFQPNAAWDGHFPAAIKDWSVQGKVWGLVTAQLKLFSIYVFPGVTSMTTFRVAGIQEVASASKHKLSHLMGA